MKLPEPFLEKMRQLLGEEYPFYEKSYEKERVHGPVSYTHLDVYKRQVLHAAALIMPLIRSKICGFLQKIRSLRNMTIHLKIFSRKSMKMSIKNSLKRQESHTFIP